jgi:hypothetical protein
MKITENQVTKVNPKTIIIRHEAVGYLEMFHYRTAASLARLPGTW